jgi:hypothetical protein
LKKLFGSCALRDSQKTTLRRGFLLPRVDGALLYITANKAQPTSPGEGG